MSEYTKELDLVNKAKKIVEESRKGRETIEATTIDLEVVTEEYVTNRIADFQKTAYLDQYYAKRLRKAKVKFGQFETITRIQKNMAVGFRWTTVLGKSGKELIDTEKIVADKDINMIYINHNQGITDEYSIFEQNIPLIENIDDEVVVVSAEGEASLYFYPGFEKYELFKSDEKEEINLNKVQCYVNCIDKHYCNLIFDGETYKQPIVVAYNKDGIKLNRAHWVVYPLYANDTTAEDYSEETYPMADNVKKMTFFALFDGEIDRLEIFFRREAETRVVPIKTIDHLPEDLQWEDYKNVSTGITNIVRNITKYDHLGKEDIEDGFFVEVTRATNPSYANEVRLKLNFPKSNNSYLSFVKYKNIRFQEQDRDELFLSYGSNNQGLSGFKYKNPSEDYNPDFIYEPKFVAGEGYFKGEVEVKYPAKLTWYKAGKGITELVKGALPKPNSKDEKNRENSETYLPGHTIEVDGGLVTYKYPADYKLPPIENSRGLFFIRAINKEGKMVQIDKHNVNGNHSEGLKFGFWGEVDQVEILICEEWITFSREICAIVTPELEVRKELDEDLVEMRKQLGTPIDNQDNYVDVYSEAESVTYSLTASVNMEHEKGYDYTWTTAILGKDIFNDKSLKIVIEEIIRIHKEAKERVPFKHRKGDIKILFTCYDHDKTLLQQLTVEEIVAKANQCDDLKKELKEYREIQNSWLGDDDTTPNPLTDFSRKIPLSYFLNFLEYELGKDNVDYTKIKDIYNLYGYINNGDSFRGSEEASKEEEAIVGKMVAYILNINKDFCYDFEVTDFLGEKIQTLHCFLTPIDEWQDIDKKIFKLLNFSEKVREWNEYSMIDYLTHQFDNERKNNFFEIIRAELEPLIGYEECMILLLKVRNTFNKENPDTSLRKHILEGSFVTFMDLATKAEKEHDYYGYLLEKRGDKFAEDKELAYEFIAKWRNQYGKAKFIDLLIQDEILMGTAHSEKVNNLFASLTSPYTAFWIAETITSLSEGKYDDMVLNHLIKIIKENEKEKFILKDYYLKWLEKTYGEKLKPLYIAYEAMDDSLKI